jgi:hypothetical protein
MRAPRPTQGLGAAAATRRARDHESPKREMHGAKRAELRSGPLLGSTVFVFHGV